MSAWCDRLYAQLGTDEKAPSKLLHMVDLLPENATTGQIEQALPEILREIGRADHIERQFVYAAISKLRDQPNVVHAFVSKYQSLAQQDYQQRFFLLQVMGELQRPDTLDHLRDVVWAPLTETIEYGASADWISPREYEELLKRKAVQGIAYLRDDAGDQLTEPEDEVLKVIETHPSSSVRIAAIDAFMWNHNDSPQAAERLYLMLPQELHKFVERPRFTKGMDRERFDDRLKIWRDKWVSN